MCWAKYPLNSQTLQQNYERFIARPIFVDTGPKWCQIQEPLKANNDTIKYCCTEGFQFVKGGT